ncbi:MAG: hypothetical protein K6C10_07180 [Prevotella sp.]|nr:hypothetical protein [Prevotella sp.]
MTTTIIVIVLLICVSLCGWAIAELKADHCVYKNSEEEDAVEEKAADAIKKNGFHELGIKDVIATISTKGFQA